MFVLMAVAVNFLNEDLNWFSRKRTLTNGGVYMGLNRGIL